MRRVAFILSLGLIFMIPWEDVVSVPGLGTAVRFMGIIVALFWVMTVVVTGQVRRPAPFHLLATLFVLWNVISILWSGNPDRTITQIVTYVQLLILVLILWDLYTTRAMVLAGLEMFILGVYVVLGDLLINYFSGTTFYYERFSATGTNPDDLGVTLALGIPIAWYLAMSIKLPRLNPGLQLLNYAYIPTAFLGIALSGTRTALLATIPGLIFGLASLTRLRLWARVAIFLFLVIAGYFLLPYIPTASLERLGSTGSELSGGDFNGRLPIWRQGWLSFLQHPLIGVGSNMFRSTNTIGKVVGKVAHNSFLSILVEVGLVGFVLFALILLLVILQAWRQTRWDARFWLALLATWVIGASTLTWENRKPTWLILSMVIIGANLLQTAARSPVNTSQPVQTPLFSGRKQPVYVEST